MKRSDKYKMLIELKPATEESNCFGFLNYQILKPYSLMWHKDNDKHAKIITVYIIDIAPPVDPEINSHIPLDVRYALHEQYGDQLNQDIQNTLDIIDDKEKLEKAFKK